MNTFCHTLLFYIRELILSKKKKLCLLRLKGVVKTEEWGSESAMAVSFRAGYTVSGVLFHPVQATHKKPRQQSTGRAMR
jgi:hypothetical protein